MQQDNYTEAEWLELFSENLRHLMIDANMTQRDLADESGLAESSISRYLRGTSMPTVKAIINLTYAFGLDTIDELIDFGGKIR